MSLPIRSLATLAALAATGLGSTAAQAQTPQLRVAVVGGLERTDSAPGSGAKDGFYYGVQVGADWDLGAVQAGVEGELGDSSAQDTTLPGQPRQALFGNVAVRLALPVTGGTRVFVRGGYAYHRIDNATGADFAGHGYVIGGGAEVDLAPSLFLRGEYRYSDYGQAVRGQHFVAGVGLRF